MLNCFVVGIGGFIGSVLRYLIGLIPTNTASFPIKTLLINIIGAFVIGAIVAISTRNTSINPQIILLLKVGVCGGFTTFSTFALESATLMQKGQIFYVFLYILLSVIFSIMAVYIAEMIFK